MLDNDTIISYDYTLWVEMLMLKLEMLIFFRSVYIYPEASQYCFHEPHQTSRAVAKITMKLSIKCKTSYFNALQQNYCVNVNYLWPGNTKSCHTTQRDQTFCMSCVEWKLDIVEWSCWMELNQVLKCSFIEDRLLQWITASKINEDMTGMWRTRFRNV